jgi:hypothetical protein
VQFAVNVFVKKLVTDPARMPVATDRQAGRSLTIT